MKNSIETLNTLALTFDLSDFYSINLWGVSGEVSLQGYFTDKNLRIVEELGIALNVEGAFLRGTINTDLGPIRIVLTAKD